MKIAEFLTLFKQGKVSAKSHMKNLLEMAMVDGQFDVSEKELLDGLAKKHKVSKKQLKEIKDDPDAIEFILPDDDNEKFEELYELVHMMVVDKYVDTQEIKLCRIFAKKFGYNPEKANELVLAIVDNVKHEQPAGETRKRVSWLL